MTQGIIFDIKRYAIHDGPGIRTAVFLKGCPLSCWWCHNPEGQEKQPQLMFRANRCKEFKRCLDACPLGAIQWKDGSITDWDACDDCGKCAEVCFAGAREMVGRRVTVQEVVSEIERDMVFYDQSGGGVTFTGGEPMWQSDFLQACLSACKELGIHTAVDTSGYAGWSKFEAILPLADLFMFDLKLMDSARHVQYTSVPNRLILDNLQKLSRAGAHIIVRIPLIPGINDDEENIRSSASFLANLPTLDWIEIMPYHAIGLAKYQALGMKYKLQGIQAPTRGQRGKVEKILVKYDLPVIKHNTRRTG
ncbi:MAG: glycyl-radical enzyme activating protein [Acidobacteriaceae bacterium]